jgi:hypothetical protein
MTEEQYEAIEAHLAVIAKNTEKTAENTEPPSKFWRVAGMVSTVVSIVGVLAFIDLVIQWSRR